MFARKLHHKGMVKEKERESNFARSGDEQSKRTSKQQRS